MSQDNYTVEQLEELSIGALRDLYRDEFNGAPNQMKKSDIIEAIISCQNGEQKITRSTRGRKPNSITLADGNAEGLEKGEQEVKEEPKKVDINKPCSGIMQIYVDGYGFLRAENYEISKQDIFVSKNVIKQYNLRNGDKVVGVCATIRENELPALQKVTQVNNVKVASFRKRINFDDLTPCYPDERFTLERAEESKDLSIRCIDLLCPIGKGQRGLIVAPPKTGKTTLLKKIALSIEKNYPSAYLMMLLVDERPEEVTEMKESLAKAEIVYSTFDESSEHHIAVAELVCERAKRLVEDGEDVIILLDSITKLTRAYNTCLPSSGKTLSGGLDPTALYGPKKFFGTARNIRGGGSLTIIATALVETGSRMDEVIYEEFKGTGNMEIILSGKLSEKRVFPAIDLYRSGTRRDEFLLTPKQLDCAYKIRKLLQEDARASENFLDMLSKTKSNDEFVLKIDEWLKIYNNIV